MTGKKAQTQQVFIYIMVILVVGAVLIFGYRAIDGMINKTCDVDVIKFQSELKATLEDSNGYLNQAFESMKAPCGYEQICFINSSTAVLSGHAPSMTALSQKSQAMMNEVTAGTGNNVFLLKGSETKPLYALDFIDVPGTAGEKGFICIEQKGGSFYMVLDGLGKGRVQVTEGS